MGVGRNLPRRRAGRTSPPLIFSPRPHCCISPRRPKPGSGKSLCCGRTRWRQILGEQEEGGRGCGGRRTRWTSSAGDELPRWTRKVVSPTPASLLQPSSGIWTRKAATPTPSYPLPLLVAFFMLSIPPSSFWVPKRSGVEKQWCLLQIWFAFHQAAITISEDMERSSRSDLWNIWYFG